MIKELLNLDTSISRWIFDKQPKGIIDDQIVENLTRIFGAIPPFIFAIIFSRNIFTTIIIFGAIIFVNFFLIELFIKKIIKRKRPAFREKSLHTYSFPSTHAATMGMIAGQFYMLPNLYNYSSILLAVFLIYGVLVMLSRVLYGHHFVLDIIAGFITGLVLSIPLVLIIVTIITQLAGIPQ